MQQVKYSCVYLFPQTSKTTTVVQVFRRIGLMRLQQTNPLNFRSTPVALRTTNSRQRLPLFIFRPKAIRSEGIGCPISIPSQENALRCVLNPATDIFVQVLAGPNTVLRCDRGKFSVWDTRVSLRRVAHITGTRSYSRVLFA